LSKHNPDIDWRAGADPVTWFDVDFHASMAANTLRATVAVLSDPKSKLIVLYLPQDQIFVHPGESKKEHNIYILRDMRIPIVGIVFIHPMHFRRLCSRIAKSLGRNWSSD